MAIIDSEEPAGLPDSGAEPGNVFAEKDTRDMTPEEAAEREREKKAVQKFFARYDADRKFDTNIRKTIRKDRAYASGEAQTNWAVSTNLVGAAINVKTSVLYARDPDVSVRPAPQVDPPPDSVTGLPVAHPARERNDAFAKSLELVLSRLAKQGRLKQRMRRVLRSVFSTGFAWLKVLPVTNRVPDPIAQNEYNTMQENLASVRAQIAALSAGQTLDGCTASQDDLEVQQQQLETSLEALAARLEVDEYYGFTFDVVLPENLQVGTDVETLEEYLDSDCLTEAIYIPHDQLREKFPELSDEDLKCAEKFYRKPPRKLNQGEGRTVLIESLFAEQGEQQFADEGYAVSENKDEGGTPMACVLESWNRRDNHVYTAIRGVKVWARKPYTPSWTSSRFYPYIYFSVLEVDGERAPQSLASNLAKLQDEYSSVRSNFRLVRRRSIPGVLFDKSKMDDNSASALANSDIAEFTGVRTTFPDTSLSDVFTPKPQPDIDMRVYDTLPILSDIERVAGIQDAQTASVQVAKTATEAEIQQTGFNSRVMAERDILETTLTEMFCYMAEVALQVITPEVAQRIAGPAVYWPVGLPVEDLWSLVDVNIVAGTTGKPRKLADREAWGVIYPAIKEATLLIGQAATNPAMLPVANALREQLRETMRLFDMEGDLDRFLPQIQNIPALPPPEAVPPGAVPPGGEVAPTDALPAPAVTDELAFAGPPPTETDFAAPM